MKGNKYNNLSIVVLNYNGYSDTKNCINKLIEFGYTNNIVLVDNKSTDGSDSLLQEKFPQLVFIQSGFNGGYAFGMNKGIKHSLENTKELILILNNDTIVTETTIPNLITEIEKESNVGIAYPKSLYMNNNNIYCGGKKINYIFCGAVSINQGKDADKYSLENSYTDCAEGACMLVKSQLFKDAGLFSENFFMYFEEVEFSLRVNNKYKICFCSNSILYHKAGAGESWDNYSELYNYYYTRNRLLLFSDKSKFYYTYVIIFSVIIVLLKSMAILLKGTEIRLRINSLWKGLIDGLTSNYKNNK